MMNLGRTWVLVISPVIVAIVIVIVIAAGQPSSTARGISDVQEAAQVAAVQPANTTSAEAQPARAPEGSGDGIQVHGHWTIVVRDPDGTIADVREIENALDPNGAIALAYWLGRSNYVGYWSIHVYEAAANGVAVGPCVSSSGGGAWCKLVEPTAETADTWRFPNLQVSVPTAQSSPNQFKLVLSGSATAGKAGSINTVFTSVGSCQSSQTLCSGVVAFTAKQFPANSTISVQPGQQIQVTVVISFS